MTVTEAAIKQARHCHSGREIKPASGYVIQVVTASADFECLVPVFDCDAMRMRMTIDGSGSLCAAGEVECFLDVDPGRPDVTVNVRLAIQSGTGCDGYQVTGQGVQHLGHADLSALAAGRSVQLSIDIEQPDYSGLHTWLQPFLYSGRFTGILNSPGCDVERLPSMDAIDALYADQHLDLDRARFTHARLTHDYEWLSQLGHTRTATGVWRSIFPRHATMTVPEVNQQPMHVFDGWHSCPGSCNLGVDAVNRLFTMARVMHGVSREQVVQMCNDDPDRVLVGALCTGLRAWGNKSKYRNDVSFGKPTDCFSVTESLMRALMDAGVTDSHAGGDCEDMAHSVTMAGRSLAFMGPSSHDPATRAMARVAQRLEFLTVVCSTRNGDMRSTTPSRLDGSARYLSLSDRASAEEWNTTCTTHVTAVVMDWWTVVDIMLRSLTPQDDGFQMPLGPTCMPIVACALLGTSDAQSFGVQEFQMSARSVLPTGIAEAFVKIVADIFRERTDGDRTDGDRTEMGRGQLEHIACCTTEQARARQAVTHEPKLTSMLCEGTGLVSTNKLHEMPGKVSSKLAPVHAAVQGALRHDAGVEAVFPVDMDDLDTYRTANTMSVCGLECHFLDAHTGVLGVAFRDLLDHPENLRLILAHPLESLDQQRAARRRMKDWTAWVKTTPVAVVPATATVDMPRDRNPRAAYHSCALSREATWGIIRGRNVESIVAPRGVVISKVPITQEAHIYIYTKGGR